MVQLINPDTIWINAVSRDFKRFNRSTDGIIDIISLNEDDIEACLLLCFQNFAAARQKYNQPIPLKFTTTGNIIYNFLCRLQFAAIAKHIAVNREVYGDKFILYKEVFLTFLVFPFKLLRNVFIKRILRTKQH